MMMTERRRFIGVSTIFILCLAGIVMALGEGDALMLSSIFPVVWAAYRYDRSTYLFLLFVTVAASIAVVFVLFGNPSESLKTIGVATLTVILLSECIHQVVLKRTELERKLKASEEQFNQIASSINHIIWLGTAADFLYVSPVCAKVFGRHWTGFPLPRKEILGLVVEEEKGAVEEFLRQPVVSPQEIEYRIRRPDGAVRTLREKVFPIVAGQDRDRRMAGVIEDVTERLAIEEELRQSKKVEALGKITASVVHDFCNVLTVVQNYAYLLQTEQPLSASQAEAVNEIDAAAGRGQTLTKRLLKFTRKEKLDRKICDLNVIVRNLAGNLTGLLGEKVALNIDAGPDPLPVYVDAVLIEQAIINLVANARDAMPEGGTVTIQSSVVTPADVTQPFAALVVADTGVGMSQEVQRHLFEPFFTTKPSGKGTGLGLPTVEQIVQTHRGRIEVTTREGQGTKFTLMFPLAGQAVEYRQPAAAPQQSVSA